MNNKRGILYPALHKFYSALNSLGKFEKGKNFFDNISYLDNFLSEYRNVTFVLQKSLSNTEHLPAYIELRDRYLANEVSRWFIEKRNEVIHKQPFCLEKKISITIYTGQKAILIQEKVFTIENDVNISTIIDPLRKEFLNSGKSEIMFSVEFSFFEEGSNSDLFDNLISGINQMKLLLTEMKIKVNQECKLSDELLEKIDKIIFYRVPKDMLFIDDYIFYCKKEYFEKASRIAMYPGELGTRSPIENLTSIYKCNNVFESFELMHLNLFKMQKTLLPTILILYSDNTFKINSFGYSIRTTLYRKFVEIAKRIEVERIVDIIFVTEMLQYNLSEVKNLSSRERVKYAKNELLAFFMVDNELKIKCHMYDTMQIDDFNYIFSVMFTKKQDQDLPSFMYPVFKEFERLNISFK